MWKGRCKKTLLFGICCWQLTAAGFAQGQEELATVFAPTVDQFFNTAGNSSQANPAQEDTATVFNFDLDWRANNNWDNLNYYKLKPPAVYYSVAETGKLYYLGYYFYYPRHLGAKPHGNDFAGLALAVEKISGNRQGRLAGVLLYDDRGWQEISLQEVCRTDSSVRVSISAGAHTLAFGEGKSPPMGSVITRKPSISGANSTAEVYQLISLDELWQRRREIQAGEAYGTLDAKAGSGDQPDLPWKWQYKGAHWLSDPAAVFRLISGNMAFASNYLSKPYAE